MSTLRDTPRHRDRIRTSLGGGVIATGALVAIVVSILFLSLTSAHRNAAPTTPNGAYPGAVAAPITAASTSTFRDPGTHALLRVGATATGATEPGAEHSQGRIVR